MSTMTIQCNGDGCKKELEIEGKPAHSEWARTDAYGIFTGLYCDECYETNYPFRKDEYFDPDYAGESLEDDY